MDLTNREGWKIEGTAAGGREVSVSCGDPIEIAIRGEWVAAVAAPTPQPNLNCKNFNAKTSDGRTLLRWLSKDNWRPRPLVHSVKHGWSMAGHYYVTIKTKPDDLYGETLVCVDKQQAEGIAAALMEFQP